MFSRQYLEDSYTLDNYIHFIQKPKNEQSNEDESNISENHIQKIEYFSQKKRKLSTQLSIFSWLIKDKPIQTSLLVSLDKELILKIYSYLRISQVFIVSEVCSYLYSCYRHLWIDRNFFQKFQTDKFTSQELNKVIEKSKLDHIKQLKQIYMGKNIRKNRQKIKMRIADGAPSTNSMLQVFTISPKIKNGTVFIMDSHLQNILNSSYKGLKCIELHRCPYIKTISNISKCLQLQKFAISYNQYVTTQSLAPVFKQCLKLQKVQISECKNLDENIFKLLKNVQNLKSLTLRFFKQSFGNLCLLANCSQLRYLNIDDSLINDDQFMNSLRQIKSLNQISIQGCALLTNLSIDFIQRKLEKQNLNLREILISRIAGIDNATIERIQQKIYKRNLQIQLQEPQFKQ